ncbi:hypothetical protein KI387_035567, partial [Taxus chinensis]
MAHLGGQGLSEALKKRLGPLGSASDSLPSDSDLHAHQDSIPSVSLVEDVAFAAHTKCFYSRAIFAKFIGRRLSFYGIINWCETQWGSGLSIHSLEKGFFLVLFRSTAQKSDTMERKFFLLSDSGLVIHDWEPLLDCNRVDMDGHQVWIRLYSLP